MFSIPVTFVLRYSGSIAMAATLVIIGSACRADQSSVRGPVVQPGEVVEPTETARDPNESDRTDREVPELVIPAQAPGSDKAYRAMVAGLERLVSAEQIAAGVPWPDLRNPDPVQAYRSCARFQEWMSQNNPTPALAEAYTAPNSPERGFDLEFFNMMFALGVTSTRPDPPYSMRLVELLHPAATPISDDLLLVTPEGSVAIVYWDSVGPSALVSSEGESILEDPGWVNVGPWVAIMAPTEVGWRVWWDELVEPTPEPSEGDSPKTDNRSRELALIEAGSAAI